MTNLQRLDIHKKIAQLEQGLKNYKGNTPADQGAKALIKETIDLLNKEL